MADANANSAESAAERHHHSSVMTDRNNDNDENCGEAAPPANKAASAVNNFFAPTYTFHINSAGDVPSTVEALRLGQFTSRDNARSLESGSVQAPPPSGDSRSVQGASHPEEISNGSNCGGRTNPLESTPVAPHIRSESQEECQIPDYYRSVRRVLNFDGSLKPKASTPVRSINRVNAGRRSRCRETPGPSRACRTEANTGRTLELEYQLPSVPSGETDNNTDSQPESEQPVSQLSESKKNEKSVKDLILRDGPVDGDRFSAFLSYLVKVVPEAADVLIPLNSNIIAAKSQQAKLQKASEAMHDEMRRILPADYSRTYFSWLEAAMVGSDGEVSENNVPSALGAENEFFDVQRRICNTSGYNTIWKRTELCLPYPEVVKRVVNKITWNASENRKFKAGFEKRARLVAVIQMKVKSEASARRAANLLQLYESANVEGESIPSIAENARMELLRILKLVDDENLTKEFNNAFKPINESCLEGNGSVNVSMSLAENFPSSSRVIGIRPQPQEEIDESPSTATSTSTVPNLNDSTSQGTSKTEDVKKEENNERKTRKRRKQWGYGWSKPPPPFETPPKRPLRNNTTILDNEEGLEGNIK